MARVSESIAGVDLGGTNVRVGIVDPAGAVLSFRAARFDAQRGAEAGLDRIAGLVRACLREAGDPPLEAIGIGATGPLDARAGRLRNPYTLTTWVDVDVRGPLEAAFGVPVALENDAVAAALGEWWQGAGRGSNCMAMVTFGTGIGVAVVGGGRVYRGSGEVHPEAGHQIVDPSGPRCYCGAQGCWEQLAAGPALRRLAGASADPALRAADASDIARLDRAGHSEAQQIVASASRYAAMGLVNVVASYAPDLIVLGGGVMGAYRSHLDEIRAIVGRSLPYLPPGNTQIVEQLLGERAGVIGAAYAAMSRPASA
ncbi:MAG: ROK family protein [Candidatus Limnocylindrales bacterium]